MENKPAKNFQVIFSPFYANGENLPLAKIPRYTVLCRNSRQNDRGVGRLPVQAILCSPQKETW